MRKCDSCGKLYQENKDVFCPHCGAVAQKQCTHGSSFDSKRYDRGELYQSNNTQYQNTTYTQGVDPHAQRKNYPYNESGNEDNFGDGFPDLTKRIPEVVEKVRKFKFTGIIIFACVFGLFMLINLVNYDGVNGTDYWEENSEEYIDEDMDNFYSIVNEASIEIIDAEGKTKTFALEITGLSFDNYLPESVIDKVTSGEMTENMLSEDTFVEMLVCDFSEKIVAEDEYNDTVNNCYYSSGKQSNNKCRYEFTYDFDYNEIVHIAGGVDFYLGNGVYINAELPFSAFSVSEDGKITYYSSYADSETSWNTVFTECSNTQVTDGYNVTIVF